MVTYLDIFAVFYFLNGGLKIWTISFDFKMDILFTFFFFYYKIGIDQIFFFIDRELTRIFSDES